MEELKVDRIVEHSTEATERTDHNIRKKHHTEGSLVPRLSLSFSFSLSKTRALERGYTEGGSHSLFSSVSKAFSFSISSAILCP